MCQQQAVKAYATLFNRLILKCSLLRRRWGAKYCDERVCMSVCLSAHVSQKPQSKPQEIFWTSYPEPWLDPTLTTVEYAMYFRFCEWPRVSYSGPYDNTYVSVLLEQVVINFQRIRQVATLFDYVVVYSGSSCAPRVIAMTTCGALSLVSGLYKIVLS